MNPSSEESLPLTDASDILILMHRDAHFGGNFDQMLSYYQKEGRGVQPEIETSRIQELSMLEQQLNQNLASVFLQGADAEKVGRARQMYQELRALYENQDKETKIAQLIADLILTEDPEGKAEIEALVKEKKAALPALLQLLRAEDLRDPLFPGYGLSQNLAVQCLGQIGDKQAIITLFETLGSGDFFDDDVAVEALKAIGEPAKAFLLKVIQGKPLTEDNEKAAIALVAFKEDPEVARLALKLLDDAQMRQDPVLSTYLVLICEGLIDEEERSAFKKLLHLPNLSKTLKLDIESVVKQWKS